MLKNELFIAALASLLTAFTVIAPWEKASHQDDQQPTVIAPGLGTAAPSDATVLFDGKGLSDGMELDSWSKPGGEPAGWEVQEGVMLAVRGQGPVISKQTFGDIQLHLEFATPSKPEGSGQGRGNSGVYLQGRYEVQILDSYGNETYPNGQCGAIYGQHPPLKNACRKPGEWQSYDIVFHGARFDGDGNKTEDATLTVFHNGVLIQDHARVTATTAAAMQAEGPTPGPLYLQDHGNPVRYRNVWLREL
ncbi:MAG: hypothetical protein ACI82F_001978 [Planctomycetota bacterium]|jgi:hypothetical protein